MSVSSSPRGEQPGRPGVTWETELRTVEQVVEDGQPEPRPSRGARRAMARTASLEAVAAAEQRAAEAERRVGNLQSSYATLTEMSRSWSERAIENGQRAAEWELYARRFYLAWKSARRRAAVLSAELTRRAPLLGQSQAALVRVRRLCELTIAVSVRAHAIEQAHDTLDALGTTEQDVTSPHAAIDRVRKLHHPADYRGRLICAECSALDPNSSSTDNAPVTHPCATITALNEPSDGAGADTARHCGGTLTHPGHQFMRLDVVFNCPGNTAAEQPARCEHCGATSQCPLHAQQPKESAS